MWCVRSFFLFSLVVFPALARSQDQQRSQRDSSGGRVRRFELGGQFTDIGFEPCIYTPQYCQTAPPHLTLGSDVTVNTIEHFALDSMLNVITSRTATSRFSDGSVAGGHGLELLVGPRAAVRAGKLGVFVDGKTGFLNWSRVSLKETNATEPDGAQAVTVQFGGGFYFAVEADAGVEYAITPRVHMRFSAGDQVIDYRRAEDVFGPPPFPTPTDWVNNAMFMAGAYVGVGKAVGEHIPAFDMAPPHRFFDKANVLLITASMLAQASDAVTTQRFLHHGEEEQDVLARPFVDQGLAGQIALAGIVNTIQISVMYGLHKMGHHRLERLLPTLTAAGEGSIGYHNLQGR